MAGASPAIAAEPTSTWWGLTTGQRPMSLHPGVAKDAVAELKIEATSGEFALFENLYVEKFGIRLPNEELNPRAIALVPFDASTAVLQKALQGLYPGRTIEVSGGPATSGESGTYTITFPGQGFCTATTTIGCLDLSKLVGNGETPLFLEGTPLEDNGSPVGEIPFTQLSPGAPDGDGQLILEAQNRGYGPTSGVSTVTDTVPSGLKAMAVEASAGGARGAGGGEREAQCVLATMTCTFSEALPPYEQIEMRISVEVQPSASSGEVNTATASGGGAPRPLSVPRPIKVNGPETFGIEDYEFIPEEVGGAIDTQAGSHPFQVTNVTNFNGDYPDSKFRPQSVGNPKDVVAELPVGFLGNPTPFQQCSDAQFSKYPGGAHLVNECPASSAVGAVTLTFNEPQSRGFQTTTAPIFNMHPLPGEPARFAFKAQGIVPAFLDASVRTGSDYGVTITSANIIQIASLLSVKLTFWGVPGSTRHDEQRGWECMEAYGTCPTSTNTTPPPFLAMPTSCAQSFQTTIHADSWGSHAVPAAQAEPLTYELPEKLDGCNRLPFDPSITAVPDVPDASTATGLLVDVHVPQTSALNAEGLAESSVKNLTVTLPQGVGLNPAGAAGLGSCPLLTGSSPAQEQEEAEGKLSGINLHSAQPANCPNDSKIANVTIRTPLLPDALTGFIYLATPAPNGEPGLNPFNTLLAQYLVVQDPVSGTLVKLPLKVTADPVTGQLTATQATPELPFEDAEIHFFGERAPLATPPRCGTYTTAASFAPWSGNEEAPASSSFQITEGAHEAACPGANLAFGPSLAAGTTNINAGAFSTLNTTISREDGQQDISSVQLHFPPGLSGILAGVPLCAEAQANAGTCGEESKIGETIVSVGLGNEPFTVTGGKVYITGPYHGAPFGLSIVNPANAGPFHLGNVIVRAKIEIDPTTAALTITTNSASEGYAIPHILDGIPLQIKHVNVTITRPGFTFNPTNCNPQQITATIGSDEGATSPVAVPFQVTNCGALKFEPKFQVSTTGKSSKAKGASLTVKLSYPAGSQGTQANIAKVKVELPKQLPSQLKTLQKACLAAVFEANPAGCPPESVVGHATVHTPLLPVPLTGPAYFVSHGGEAFPDLTLVLQGYGVTVDLVGSTFISKAGITSSTFKAAPDVPFNTFELTLPQGKYAALTTYNHATAGGSLCGQSLKMPTEFRAQNGAEIHQSTPITVTGCPPTRAQKLAAALKACNKKHGAKRAACQKAANRKYGPLKKKK